MLQNAQRVSVSFRSRLIGYPYMDPMLGSHTRVMVLLGQGRLPLLHLLSQVERFRLRRPSSLLAQPVISATWRFHLRSSDIVTLRYFVCWTDLQTCMFHIVLMSDLVRGFSSYAHYLALALLKGHVPFLGPRR